MYPNRDDTAVDALLHRGLVHAYWAPNAWAGYLFLDRALLAMLKMTGLAGKLDGVGSTTGKGWVRQQTTAPTPLIFGIAVYCHVSFRFFYRIAFM